MRFRRAAENAAGNDHNAGVPSPKRSRTLSLRRLRFGPRVSILLAVPLLAVLGLLVSEGLTHNQQRVAVNTFADLATDLQRVEDVVAALQSERSETATRRLQAPGILLGEEAPTLDSALAAFEETEFGTVAALATLRAETERARDAARAPGTDSVDAGFNEYTDLISQLLAFLRSFTVEVSDPAISRNVEANVALLQAIEQLELQDLQLRFTLAQSSEQAPGDETRPDRISLAGMAAVGRANSLESDALDQFRRHAPVAPVLALNEAMRQSGWRDSIRLRDQFSAPVAGETFTIEEWSTAASSRFALVTGVQQVLAEELATSVEVARKDATLEFIVLLLAGSIAGLIVLAAMRLLRRSITEPVGQLLQAAQQLREGQFAPVGVAGNDELSQVERAFNDVETVVLNLMHEFSQASEKFIGGDLEARVKLDGFSGTWFQLGSVINQGIDTVANGVERERAANRHAEFATTHDLQTGLPGRELFRDKAIERFGKHMSEGTSVLVVAPEQLGALRSVYGEEGVSVAMVGLGRRIQGALPADVLIGRLSTTEYVIAIDQEPLEICEAVQQVVTEPLTLLGRKLHVPLAIGFVGADGLGTVPDHVSMAVLAAQHAAGRRRNGPTRFHPSMMDGAVRRATVRDWLDQAISEHQLEAWFQPVFDVMSGELSGYEALARGRMDGTPVSPGEFIVIAEEEGLIGDLGDLMMQRAFAGYSELAGDSPTLSINFAVQQLRESDIVERVASHLSRHNIDPVCLVVELTESEVLGDEEAIVSRLGQLRELGVRFAVDDFGTGYSSLSYLSRLPLSIIKLDRSIVTPITTSASGAAVVQSTIDLAHDLGLVVVAEGVELAGELEMLRSMGCDRVQGYLTGRPAPAHQSHEITNGVIR